MVNLAGSRHTLVYNYRQNIHSLKEGSLMAHDDMNDDAFNEEESNEATDEQTAESKEAAAEDDIEYGSQAARDSLRESMAADVEAFLARGGSIQEVAPDVMADPPRKPQTNYGSRPI
jgi:F0F1-type ATP synthase membrane subunit b/b'|tara:strand:+ start:5004 stop:5354 length:351 start_codon:yes stop_codon:yes gene_type:complete